MSGRDVVMALDRCCSFAFARVTDADAMWSRPPAMSTENVDFNVARPRNGPWNILKAVIAGRHHFRA